MCVYVCMCVPACVGACVRAPCARARVVLQSEVVYVSPVVCAWCVSSIE